MKKKAKNDQDNLWIRVSLAGCAVLLALVALNFSFFWKQLQFKFNPPQPQPIEQRATDAPNRLWVGSLGIEAPIVFSESDKEKDFQDALKNGVVHYPNTAMVGDPGNAYIFGHSSDFIFTAGDYKTVFVLLPQIEIGSEVRATNSAGEVFNYRVTEKFVVSPEDLSVLAQDPAKHILTLQTSYPIGTALKRFIVVAELVVD